MYSLRTTRRHTPNHPPKTRLPVKARLGGGVGGGAPRRLPQQKQHVGVKSRLGGLVTKGIRGRIGGMSGGVVGSGVKDARVRINLARVAAGRIGDARGRIEEKKRGRRGVGGVVLGGFVGGGGGGGAGGGGVFREPHPLYLQPHPQGPYRRTAPTLQSTSSLYSDDMILIQRQRRSAAHPQNHPQNHTQNHPPNHLPLTRTIIRNDITPSMEMDTSEENDRYHYTRRQPHLPLPPKTTPLPPHPPPQKITVSNLQPSVTVEDIVELFSDISPGSFISTRLTTPSSAEVVYASKKDALRAVEVYHNRLLDGAPMRIFLDDDDDQEDLDDQVEVRGSSSSRITALKSAAGASGGFLLGGGVGGGGKRVNKITPDIQAIHKVLFSGGGGGSGGGGSSGGGLRGRRGGRV